MEQLILKLYGMYPQLYCISCTLEISCLSTKHPVQLYCTVPFSNASHYDLIQSTFCEQDNLMQCTGSECCLYFNLISCTVCTLIHLLVQLYGINSDFVLFFQFGFQNVHCTHVDMYSNSSIRYPCSGTDCEVLRCGKKHLNFLPHLPHPSFLP